LPIKVPQGANNLIQWLKWLETYKDTCKHTQKTKHENIFVIEDEKHFIVDCPLYENVRVKCFDKVIDLCPNFRYMDTSSKYVWVFTNEHEQA
jgi:hypothetical protein